ncbi:MAG: radical SAM protein [Nitrospirae bacterium]|nr:radical SAM protein [Nitrospirota bacterium]
MKNIKQEIENLEKYFPLMIIFDITNVCNLHCIHCPHDDLLKRKDYKRTHIDPRIFMEFISQIKDHPLQFIRITGDGEPLMHPDILEMLKFVKSVTNIPINLTTNATLLNERMAEAILSLNIDVIDVSLDALYRDSYEKIRGFDYETVMKNVFNLLFLRRKYHSTTKIMVNAINRNDMKDEINTFARFWDKLADFVAIRNLHSASGSVNYDTLKIERESIERYPCPHLWKRLTIDFNGNVKFCAHDWYNCSVIGNIERHSFVDISNNAQLRMVRDAHLAGEYHKINICKDCIDWSSVKWDSGYEKIMDILKTNQ